MSQDNSNLSPDPQGTNPQGANTDPQSTPQQNTNVDKNGDGFKDLSNTIDLNAASKHFKELGKIRSSVPEPDYGDMAFKVEEKALNFEELNKYDVGLLRGMDQNEVRASNQSDLVAFGIGVAKIVPEFLGDVVYAIGSLGEIPEMITQGYTDFDNALMKLGENIRETDAFGKIYASQQAQQGFRFFDGEWWALNVGSIASAISLAIPAVGTIRALGALGNLARFGKLSRGFRITDFTKKIGQGLAAKGISRQAAAGFGQALVSRHFEMMMEGKETFDEIYKYGIEEKNLSEEDARKLAGEAAMAHYGTGYVAMLTDAPQFMMGLMGKKLGKAAGKSFKGLIANMLGEGGEEVFQYILGEEARRYGKDTENYRLGQAPLEKYFKDPALYTSGFFGALGGGVFYGGIGGAREKIKNFGQKINGIFQSKDPEVEAARNIIEEGVKSGDQEALKKTLNALNDELNAANPDNAQDSNIEAINAAIDASNPSNSEDPNGPNQQRVSVARGMRAFYNNLINTAQNKINTLVSGLGSSEVVNYNITKKRISNLEERSKDPTLTPYQQNAIQDLLNEEKKKLSEIESKEGFNAEDYKINEEYWTDIQKLSNEKVGHEVNNKSTFLEEQDLKNGNISDEYIKTREMTYNDKLKKASNYDSYQSIIKDAEENLDNPSFSKDANQDKKARDFFQTIKNRAIAQRDARVAKELQSLNMSDYNSFGEYMTDVMSSPFISGMDNDAKTKLEATQAEKWDKANPNNKSPKEAKYKYNIGKVFATPNGGTAIVSNIDPEGNTYTIKDSRTEEETTLPKEQAEELINNSEKGDVPILEETPEAETAEEDTSANDDDTSSGTEEVNSEAPAIELQDPEQEEGSYADFDVEAARTSVQQQLEQVRRELQDLINEGRSTSYNDFYIAVIDLASRHSELYNKNPLFKKLLSEFINDYDYKNSFKKFQRKVKKELGVEITLTDVQERHDALIKNNRRGKLASRKRRHVKKSKLEYDKEYTIEELDAILDQLDVDDATRNIFEKLKENAKKFGLKIIFPSPDSIVFGTGRQMLGGIYDHANKKIYINIPALFQSGDVSKAIVHEMVHGTLDYMFHLLNTNPEALTEEQMDVIYDLELIRQDLVRDPEFANEFALTNTREMLAALTDQRFVNKLKNKKVAGKANFFERIIQGILKLIGFPTTYYDLVAEGFDLLNNSTKVEDFNTSVDMFNKAVEDQAAAPDPSEGAVIDESGVDGEIDEEFSEEEDIFDENDPEAKLNKLKEQEAHLERALKIIDIVEKRNAERETEIQNELIDGFIDEIILDEINDKYDKLIEEDISKLEKIEVTTKPKQKKTTDQQKKEQAEGRDYKGVENLTPDDVKQLIENPDKREALIGKFHSSKSIDSSNGSIQLEFYEGGIVQTITIADNVFTFQRVTDLEGNYYGQLIWKEKTGEDLDSAGAILEKELGSDTAVFVTHDELSAYIGDIKNEVPKDLTSTVIKEETDTEEDPSSLPSSEEELAIAIYKKALLAGESIEDMIPPHQALVNKYITPELKERIKAEVEASKGKPSTEEKEDKKSEGKLDKNGNPIKKGDRVKVLTKVGLRDEIEGVVTEFKGNRVVVKIDKSKGNTGITKTVLASNTEIIKGEPKKEGQQKEGKEEETKTPIEKLSEQIDKLLFEITTNPNENHLNSIFKLLNNQEYKGAKTALLRDFKSEEFRNYFESLDRDDFNKLAEGILKKINISKDALKKVDPSDIIYYIFDQLQIHRDDFGNKENVDESPALETSGFGEKIMTLDSWVDRIPGTELFTLRRNFKTGNPWENNFISELKQDGYEVDVHFLRNMHLYGDPFEFKIKFKVPVNFKRNVSQTNPEPKDLYILVTVIDNSGKEHHIGFLNKESEIGSQTSEIRNELFKAYKKALLDKNFSGKYIESSGFAIFDQIRPGRVNNSTRAKRRRVSEVWDKLSVKGIAVALPIKGKAAFDLKMSNLQGTTDRITADIQIQSDRLRKNEDNLFILAQDTSGEYRWVRVYQVNVGKHAEVKAKVDDILNKIREHSIAIRKSGTRKTSTPEFREWQQKLKAYKAELISLVRYKKFDENGNYSYEPNIKQNTLFEKEYLDENGFFSPEAFIESHNLYNRPCQVDYTKLSNDVYVESVLDRMETSLLDGDFYVYPAFRFKGYEAQGSSEDVSEKQKPSSKSPFDPSLRKESTPPQSTSTGKGASETIEPTSKKRGGGRKGGNIFKGDPPSPFRGKKFRLNEEQARKEMKELLGDFPLQIVDGLINVGSFQAYGVAKRSLIKLSNQASNKTLYHEAFHIVFRGMLSDETRQTLLAEAKERYNLTEAEMQEARMIYDNLRKKYKNLPESTIEEIALEEKMANEFQEYRIADTGVKGALRKFFRVLKNFIKKISGNWKQIDTVFRKLDRGEYKEGIVANNFNDAFQPFELTTLQIQQSVSSGLAALDLLLKKEYENNPDSLMSIYANALNEDPELDLITSTDPYTNSVVNAFIGYAIENPAHQEGILKVLKALRPDIKEFSFNEDGKIDDIIIYEIEPVKGPLYIEFLKGLASRGYSIKLDTSSLIEKDTDDTTDEQDSINKDKEENPRDAWSYDQSKISPKENMGYFIKRALSLIKKEGKIGFHGMPLYYDHHQLYPELQRVIGGAHNIPAMLKKLDAHPIFKQLKEYYEGWNNNQVTNVEELKKNARANKFVVQLFKLAQQKNSNTHVMVYLPGSNREANKPLYIKANRFTINKYITNNLKNLYKEGGQSILDLPLTKEAKAELGNKRNERLLSLLESHWLEAKKLLKESEEANPKESPAITLQRELQLKTHLGFLTDTLADFYVQDFQDTTFSVEGEKLFEWGKPGFLSNLLNKAKNDPRTFQEFYFKDPLYKNLSIFKYLKQITISSNGGIKYKGDKKGTSYDKLTTADHYNIMINSWFNNDSKSKGHISLPIYSDSPVNEMMEVNKLNNEEALGLIKEVFDFESNRIQQVGKNGTVANAPSNFAKNASSRLLVPQEMGSDVKEFEAWARKTASDLAEKLISDPNIQLHEGIELDPEKLQDYLTNFVLNHVAWQGQMILITAGDPAFYKSKGVGNVVDDFFKRVKELYSPVTYASSDAFWSNSKGEVTKVPSTMNIRILPDIETPAPQLNQLGKILGDENLSAYEQGVSLTDGMTLLTPHSYKYRMIAMGEWTEAKDLVWKLISSGKLPSKKHIDAIVKALPENSPIIEELKSIRSFETIKPYVYTMVLQKVLNDPNTSKLTPFQKKDSEILMIPFYGLKKIKTEKGEVDNPLYNPFYKRLLEESGYVFNPDGTVDYSNVDTEVDNGVYTFDSTLKAYKPNLNLSNEYNVEESIDSYLGEGAPIVSLSYDAWGKQQENPSHYYESSELFGTQIQKLIIVDLKNNHPNYDKIVKAYQQLIIDNIKISYAELTDEISNWNDLIKKLREDVINRGLGDDFLEMLQLDENGDPTVPLWHPVNSKTIESLLSSMYRKGVSDQKFSNGYSLINRSAVGFAKKPRIVFKDADGKIIKANDTESVPKSIAYMEAILPVTNKEIAEYINDEGFIDQEAFNRMPESLKESIGYRIPNEYFYSDFKIKAIAFDPFSDTMTLPHEITAIAGLDFDIDKVKGFGAPSKVQTALQIAKRTNAGRKIVEDYNKRIEKVYEDLVNTKESIPELKLELAALSSKISDLSLSSDPKEAEKQLLESLNSEEYKELKKRLGDLYNYKDTLYQNIKDLVAERDDLLLTDFEVVQQTERIQTKRANEKTLFNLMWNDILGDPSVASKQLKPGGFATVERLANKYKEGDVKLLMLDPVTTVNIAQRMNQGKALTGIAANALASNALWQHYNIQHKDGFLTRMVKLPVEITNNIKNDNFFNDKLLNSIKNFDAKFEANGAVQKVFRELLGNPSNHTKIIEEVLKFYKSFSENIDNKQSYNYPNLAKDLINTPSNANAYPVIQNLIKLAISEAAFAKKEKSRLEEKQSISFTQEEVDSIFNSMINNLTFKNGTTNIEIEELTNLSKEFDNTGVSKIQNMAEFLAAAVDNGKNPLAGYINVNSATSDYLFGLLSLGYSIPQAISVLNDPLVLQYTEDALLSKSKLANVLPKAGSSILYFDADGNVLNSSEDIAGTLFGMKDLVSNISDLITNTKIGDGGLGANLSESAGSERRYQKAAFDNYFVGAKEMFESSLEIPFYMGTLVEYGISLPLDTIVNQIGFPNIKGDTFKKILNKAERLKKNIYEKWDLTNDQIDSLYRQYFEYLGSVLYDYDMFKKSYAENRKKLMSLQKSNPNNKFLKKLEFTKAGYIIYQGNINMDRNEVQDIKNDVKKLPSDVLEFLKVYSFYASGFRFTMGGFNQLLPLKTWANKKDFETLKSQLEYFDKDDSHVNNFLDQFIRNNFRDLDYIPEPIYSPYADPNNPSVLYINEHKRQRGIRFPYLKTYVPGYGNVLFKYHYNIKKWVSVSELSTYEDNTKRVQRYFFGEHAEDVYSSKPTLKTFTRQEFIPPPSASDAPPMGTTGSGESFGEDFFDSEFEDGDSSIPSSSNIPPQLISKEEEADQKPTPTEQPSTEQQQPVEQEGRKDISAVSYENLNDRQKNAHNRILDFFMGNNKGVDFLLQGKAGTGKTTIIKFITQKLAASASYMQKPILVLAPTNQAANNLKNAGVEKEETIKVSTISSGLGEEYDPTSNNFKRGKKTTAIEEATYIIIDEASMISESTYAKIREQNPTAKILFAGDSGQLIPVREGKDYLLLAKNLKLDPFIISELENINTEVDTSRGQAKTIAEGKLNDFVKKHKLGSYLSRPFLELKDNDNSSVKLFERVRQGEDSSILPWADHAWDSSHSDKKNKPKNPYSSLQRIDTEELVFIKEEEKNNLFNYAIERYKKAIKENNPNLFRIIGYRNATVNKTNARVRQTIFGDNPKPYYKGELLRVLDPFRLMVDGQAIAITKNTAAQIVGRPEEREDYFFKNVIDRLEVAGLLPKTFYEQWSKVKIRSHQLPLKIYGESTTQRVPFPEDYNIIMQFRKALKQERNKLKFSNPSAYRQLGGVFRYMSDAYVRFDYAYAINSHQSQGSTYAEGLVLEDDIYSVTMDDPDNLSKSMYTAITRFSDRVFISSTLNGKVNPNGQTVKSPKEQALDFYTKELPEATKNVKISKDKTSYVDGSNTVMRNTHFISKPKFEKLTSPVQLTNASELEQRMANYSNGIVSASNNPLAAAFGGVTKNFNGDETIMLSVNSQEELAEIKALIDKAMGAGGWQKSVTFVFKTIAGLTKEGTPYEKDLIRYLYSKGVSYYEHDGLGMYVNANKSQLSETATTIGTKVDRFLRDYFSGVLSKDLSTYEIVEKGNEGALNGLIRQLDQFSKYLESKGETPIALESTFIDLYNGIGTTLDLVTVDEAGEERVYDIKTMRGDKISDGRYEEYDRAKHQKQLSIIRITAFNSHGRKYNRTGYIIPVVLNVYNANDTRVKSLTLKGDRTNDFSKGEYFIKHKLLDSVTNEHGDIVTFDGSKQPHQYDTAIPYTGGLRQFRPLEKTEKAKAAPTIKLKITYKDVKSSFDSGIDSLTLNDINVLAKNNRMPEFTSLKQAKNWASEYLGWVLDGEGTALEALDYNLTDKAKASHLESLEIALGDETKAQKEFEIFEKFLNNTNSILRNLPIPTPSTSPAIETGDISLGTETAPTGGNVVIDAVKGKSPQPNAVVAFRTKGKTEQNMIDALADNAVGNPFGPYAAIKVKAVGEAVTRFLNWLEGKGDTNVMQNYRNALLAKVPELKGKTIYYYQDLGRPSHATALDYFLNGPVTQAVNPLSQAGVKPTDMYGNAAKDIQMASESTQFIGFQSGSATVSSTNKYRLAWGDRANTGNYTSSDVVMVSGSGTFRGVTEAQILKTLKEKYKPLLEQAIEAGASFRVGNQYAKGNLSDKLVADYLSAKGYIEEKMNGYSRWSKTTQPTQQSQQPTNVKEVADGVKIIDNALTASEEKEIFEMLKPYLESQGGKTNKGKNAPIMIGLGVRWDYKSNNPNKKPIEIKRTIDNSSSQRSKYAYYDVSIDGDALGPIPSRLKELITRATGIDSSNYDGAIINIYQQNSFISAHNDVDESATAINYPVLVLNIGGSGSLSIEGAESQKAKKGYSSKEYIDEPLTSGSAYIFGEDGKNRNVFHRTLPSDGKGNLPALNIKGEIIPANSYRMTVTLRRVKDLEPGMPVAPVKTTQLTQKSSTQPTTQSKMFDPNDKSIRAGAVVKYNGKTYLLWNINNSAKAQLIGIDGSKFSGTPSTSKLQVIGGYKTTMYNGTKYIVTDNNIIYSTATGKKVYEGLDDSSKKQKQTIIDQAEKAPKNAGFATLKDYSPIFGVTINEEYITLLKSDQNPSMLKLLDQNENEPSELKINKFALEYNRWAITSPIEAKENIMDFEFEGRPYAVLLDPYQGVVKFLHTSEFEYGENMDSDLQKELFLSSGNEDVISFHQKLCGL